MTCEQRQDEYLLLAADQLDPTAAAELHRHLAEGCPTCAGAWTEAQAVFAAIGSGVEPAPVPESARRKLLARINAPPTNRSGEREREGWGATLFRIGVSAAVAAGIAVVVTHHIVTLQSNRQSAAQVAQRDALLEQRDARIDSLLSELVHVQQRQQATLALLQSPTLKLAELQGKNQPKAAAQLLLNSGTRQWALLASNLAPLPSGRTYEFWYITAAGQKIRAGTFSADTSGAAELQDQIPADVGAVAMTAVTDEPAGGTDQPTGSIQLAGKLP